MSDHQRRVRYVVEGNLDSRILWTIFTKSHYPEFTISRTVFCRSRPSYIRLIKYTKRRQCLCQRLANIALKGQAVKVLPQSLNALVNISDDTIKIKVDNIKGDHEINYRTWGSQDVEYKERTVKKVKLIEIKTTKEPFVDTFIKEMPVFRAHCDRVKT